MFEVERELHLKPYELAQLVLFGLVVQKHALPTHEIEVVEDQAEGIYRVKILRPAVPLYSGPPDLHLDDSHG
jgi:hypothetical protein